MAKRRILVTCNVLLFGVRREVRAERVRRRDDAQPRTFCAALPSSDRDECGMEVLSSASRAALMMREWHLLGNSDVFIPGSSQKNGFPRSTGSPRAKMSAAVAALI